MADREEAARIWTDIIALERTMPGAQENKDAFFVNKKKAMDKLRTQYEAATGLPTDPTNTAMNKLKSNRQAFDSAFGGGKGHQIRDDVSTPKPFDNL